MACRFRTLVTTPEPHVTPPPALAADGWTAVEPATIPERCPVLGKPVCYYADCRHWSGGGGVHPEGGAAARRRRRRVTLGQLLPRQLKRDPRQVNLTTAVAPRYAGGCRALEFVPSKLRMALTHDANENPCGGNPTEQPARVESFNKSLVLRAARPRCGRRPSLDPPLRGLRGTPGVRRRPLGRPGGADGAGAHEKHENPRPAKLLLPSRSPDQLDEARPPREGAP